MSVLYHFVPILMGRKCYDALRLHTTRPLSPIVRTACSNLCFVQLSETSYSAVAIQ